jgi:hypothetical protein
MRLIFGGAGGRLPSQSQWQPAIGAHDPSPPLPIGDTAQGGPTSLLAFWVGGAGEALADDLALPAALFDQELEIEQLADWTHFLVDEPAAEESPAFGPAWDLADALEGDEPTWAFALVEEDQIGAAAADAVADVADDDDAPVWVDVALPALEELPAAVAAIELSAEDIEAAADWAHGPAEEPAADEPAGVVDATPIFDADDDISITGWAWTPAQADVVAEEQPVSLAADLPDDDDDGQALTFYQFGALEEPETIFRLAVAESDDAADDDSLLAQWHAAALSEAESPASLWADVPDAGEEGDALVLAFFAPAVEEPPVEESPVSAWVEAPSDDEPDLAALYFVGAWLEPAAIQIALTTGTIFAAGRNGFARAVAALGRMCAPAARGQARTPGASGDMNAPGSSGSIIRSP